MVRIFLFFHRENLALICSHSAGSVQTALSKLEREGFVSSTVSLQGKRRKKLFSITPSGREAFAAWAAQPIPSIAAQANTALEQYTTSAVATLAFVLAVTNILCPFMVRWVLKRHPAGSSQTVQ